MLAPHRQELQDLGVVIFNYFLPSKSGEGYETFHANADEDAAYVGSTNLLLYAGRSMELGILVEGTAARAIAATLSAAKRVSPAFSP